MFWMIVINSILVSAAVLIHFEALEKLTRWIPQLPIRRRLSILFGIFGALVAHVLEIWLFAFGYYFLVDTETFGTLKGPVSHTLLDCAYFSITCYTSLGFGDVHPVGPIRFLAGLEALTGVVLIAWTASFMYVEMQKLWRVDR